MRRRSSWSWAVTAMTALAVVSCGGGGGGGGDTPAQSAPPPSLRTLSLPSAQTGLTYDITVQVPAGYASSTDAKPVIYAMDHELQFGVVQSMVQVLHIDAIIVSIGNLGSARRFIDFDLPGAEPYFRMLTLELIPLIEAQYRVDGARRTLMGYSLSGLMAEIALLEDGPASRYFSGFVVTDPSLQFHTSELLAAEQRLWDTTHALPVSVYHCTTVAGPPSNTLPLQIQARGYTGLRYHFELSTANHGTVLGPCVQEGLRYVFAAP